ncbi:alpha-tocopherol transfer protein-like isoform X1 [Haemaphysalis longicornis]
MSGVYTRKCADDVFDASEGALPFKLQRIAEDELGETPAVRHEAVGKLKQLLSAEADLKANDDVTFLLRFLRVRKYNVDLALQTIRNYYRNRAACESIYREFLPSKALPHTRRLLMVLPETDVHGRPVFLCKPGAWNPTEANFEEMQRGALLCLEHLAGNPAAQTLGMVLLLDYADFTADKVFYCNIGLLRSALEYIQDCMPMRMKAVHFVRQSYAFDIFFALIRPFVKAKLAGRFQFHGTNFERLHEEISPKVLPEEYGGQGTPLDFEAFWRRLGEQEQEFTASSHFGYSTGKQDDLPEKAEDGDERTVL